MLLALMAELRLPKSNSLRRFIQARADPSSVSSNIHQHSATETALVSSVPANQSTAGFTLDANVLARHESATDDVRKLLNSIFTEEEPEQPESAPASLTGEGALTPLIANFIAGCWIKNNGPEKRRQSCAVTGT